MLESAHSSARSSSEVRFADGRPSKFFYWDNFSGRRLRPDMLSKDQALAQAKALARVERDKRK